MATQAVALFFRSRRHSAAPDGEPAEVTTDGPLFRDSDEWPGTRYHRGDEVLHIEFRKWADLFIVAPSMPTRWRSSRWGSPTIF